MTKVWAVIQAHPYVTVFLFALVVRVVIAVFLSGYFTGRYVFDNQTYEFMTEDMAAGTTQDWDPFVHSLYWRTVAFLGPVTLIYKILGPVKLAAQIFVALLGAGAATLLVRLLSEFMTRAWALTGGFVIALLPSQAFWSSMLMKDAAVWLALIGAAVSVAVAGRSTGRRLLLCGMAAALSLTALAFLREHTLVVASWAVMIGAFAGIKMQRGQRVAGAILIGVTIPWFIASIGPAGFGLILDHGSLVERRFYNAVAAETAVVDTSRPPPGSAIVPPAVQQRAAALGAKATTAENQAVALEQAAAQAQSEADRRRAQRLAARTERQRERAAAQAQAERRRARGLAARAERLREQAATLRGLAAAEVAEASSPGEGTLDPNIEHLPRGLSVMLLEPFPVPFTGSFSLRLARLESLLWYPLLVLAAIGLWQARRHLRVLLMPLMAGGGILVTYALTEGNIGTAHRHRGEFVWVVVVLAVLGLRRLLSPPAAAGKG